MGFEYSSYNEFDEQLNTKFSVHLQIRIHWLPEKIIHIFEGSSKSFLLAFVASHISSKEGSPPLSSLYFYPINFYQLDLSIEAFRQTNSQLQTHIYLKFLFLLKIGFRCGNTRQFSFL